MEIQTLKEVVYQDDNFKFSYSTVNDMAFLHCTVYHYSPSVLKKMISELGIFLETTSERGIKTVATLTENPKFIESLGGIHYSTIEKDGIKAEMYVWE